MSGQLVLNDSFEILTPSGWQNFLGIKKDVKRTVDIRFTDGNIFSCTPEHLVLKNNKLIAAGSLKPRDIVYPNKRVVSVTLSKKDFVYDPIEVSGNNTYLSENLVSHNCNFLGSSLTLISGEAISRMSVVHPIYSNGQGLDIYENVLSDHIYVTCVDTAKGVGGDSSAFCIIDITTVPYKIAVKYKSNEISPLLLPNIIYEVSKKYNDSFVLIELNTNEQVPHILHYELEYDNVVWTMKDKGMQTISAGFKKQMKPGVIMDKKVKRIGCHNLKSLVETGKLLITDVDIISEFSTFIEKRGSFEADEGYHDDLVMSLVIFAWLITTRYFKEINTVDLRKALYEEKMRQIEEDMLPFGIIDTGGPPPEIVETSEFDKFLMSVD